MRSILEYFLGVISSNSLFHVDASQFQVETTKLPKITSCILDLKRITVKRAKTDILSACNKYRLNEISKEKKNSELVSR